MKKLVNQRPFTFALFVMLILELFVLAGLFLSHRLNMPLVNLDLPLMVINCLVAAALLTALGWWRKAGFNGPSNWRELHLLIFPALLLIGPALLLQPALPTAGKLIPLVIVTLLIGFQEEAIFRGVLLRSLQSRGVMQAVLISAGLFGVIHANSLLVGRDPLFVLAQVIASFLGAIGLGALRLRLNTIWPLILLHALNDFVQFSATGGIEATDVALIIPVAKIVLSALMAGYGLLLLRGNVPARQLSVEGV